MSAIKRFFSSHKTSSHSKVNNTQQQETQIKSSNNVAVVEKVTVEHEESKENMASPPFPSTEIILKYIMQ